MYTQIYNAVYIYMYVYTNIQCGIYAGAPAATIYFGCPRGLEKPPTL